MITDLNFWLLAIVGTLLTGVSKGGFAGALGGFGVPLMALVISPIQAASIMLPILIAMDAYGLKVFWKKCDWIVLRSMAWGIFLGMLVGTFTFGALSPNGVRVTVGAIAVAFPVYKLLERFARGRDVPAGAISWFKGNLWSTVSGYTSFIAHAGGPPFSVYVMPLKLDKQVYAATAAIYFAIVNIVKLPSYWALGQINLANWGMALLLCPLVPVGIQLGMWMQGKIKSDENFYLITQGMMFLTGLKLVWDGLRGMGLL
jgi:uncharacterized protein